MAAPDGALEAWGLPVVFLSRPPEQTRPGWLSATRTARRFDGRSFQWRWRSCLKSARFLYYSAGIPGQLMILFETGLLHLMERQRRCPEPNNFCQRSCKDELLWRVGPTNNSLQRCVSVGRSGRYVVSIPPILFFETGKPTRVRAITPRYLSEERVKTDVAVVKREPRVYPHFQEVRSIIVAKVVVMVIGPNRIRS